MFSKLFQIFHHQHRLRRQVGSSNTRAAMKPQTGAVNVLERTSNYLRSGVLSKQPAWFTVVGQHPPNKAFLKEPKNLQLTQAFQPKSSHIGTKVNKALYKTRESQQSASNRYRPQKLQFVEDELRSLFYEQHPWELSRPKILLENNGNETTKQDWSSIKQEDKPLDGESVVQRTLYLLQQSKGPQQEPYTLESAYEQARFEFYRVRIEQEIEEQVAGEENGMFGAVYQESALEHGVAKEQEFIDAWKVKAAELTDIENSRKASPQDQWGEAAETDAADAVESK